MDPTVIAAWIAAGVSVLTLVGTLTAQYLGYRASSRDAEKAEKAAEKTAEEQRKRLDQTFGEQREQLKQTLDAQARQLDRTLNEQRTRTFNERFATAAGQLGSDKPPEVRLAGIYAMAGLADDWEESRQTCIDVLCGYLRMPYASTPGDAPELLSFQASREVRHTVIRVITAHLQSDAAASWQGLDFDFRGVILDGGDFSRAQFTRGTVDFTDAHFPSGHVDFRSTEFSGATVIFSFADFSGGKVNFEKARVSGGTIDFSYAQFSDGWINFHEVRFSGGAVDFECAHFSGAEVWFIDCEDSGGTIDFSEVDDWSVPPAIDWTDTPSQAVKLPKVRLPKKKNQSDA
jgi:hypothetical protein